MPIIEIKLLPGRTLDQKRDFAKKVAQLTSETLGGPVEKVRVIFTTMNPDDYAIGGEMIIDTDPRFKKKSHK